MLTLYDLSTYNYIKNGLKSMEFHGKDFFKVQVLLDNDITNFGLLEEYINIGREEFQEEILLSALDSAKTALIRMNKKTHKRAMFTFPDYDFSIHPKDALEKCDKQVDSSSLILSPIQLKHSKMKDTLTGINIYDLKRLLGTRSLNDKNALLSYTSDISIKNLHKIIHAIEFYDKQIMRVTNNIPKGELPDNIFTLNSLEKEKIIDYRLDDIVAIIFAYHEFVWGSLSNNQKDKYPNAILNPKTMQDKELKENFITIIRDYTTLEELQDLELAPTLRRFKKDSQLLK